MADVDFVKNVPQVQPASLPGVTISNKAVGLDVIKAQQEFGGAIEEVADAARFIGDRQDETSAKDADNVLSKKIRTRLFGDGTEENPGYYRSLGNNALGERAQVEEDLNRFRKEASEGLSKGAARKLSKTADSRLSTALNGAAKHSFDQGIKVELATSLAREEEAYQDAAADPEGSRKYVDTASEEAASRARKRGAGKDEIIHEKGKALTKGHTAVITALLARPKGGAADARKYYDDNLVEIDGNVRESLLTKIKSEELDQESQQAADAIMGAYHASPSTDFQDERAAMGKARKIKDEGVRDATVLRVGKRIAEEVRFADQERKELRISAIQKIDAQKEDTVTVREKEALMSTTGGIAYWHSGGRKAADIKAGKKNLPDEVFMDRLERMPAEDFVKVPLTSDENVRKLGTALIATIKEQGRVRDQLNSGANIASTPRQIKVEALKEVATGKAAEFSSRYDDDLEAAAAGKPKGFKLPASESRKIAQRLLLRMRREKSSVMLTGGKVSSAADVFGVDDTARLFEIDPGEVNTFEVDDLASNRDNLVRMFGITDTETVGLIVRVKKQYGKATLDNIGDAIEQMRRARALKEGGSR